MQSSTKSVKSQSIDGRSQRRIDNGQRLLEAALELLEHKAYSDISVEDICESAGVGRATFFRAFNSKSGLIIEYNRRLAERVERQLALLEPPDAIQALRIVASVFADNYGSASPGLVSMALDHLVTQDVSSQEETTAALIKLLEKIIKNGIAEGSILDDMPSNLVACLILYRLSISVSYWLMNQEHDIHKILKSALNSWLHGSANKDF